MNLKKNFNQADLFSGALFIKLALDLDLYIAVTILLLISALFTIGGGASAVIWTDFIQTIFMIAGAVFLMIMGFLNVGGIESVYTTFNYAISSNVLFSNSSCGIPTDEYFNVIRSIDSDLPWTGMVLGLGVTSVWYWCSE